MRERLEEVLKDQGATCEEDALSLIIRSAGGGLRDALGLTEQLIVSTGGCITTQDAKKKLGVLDTDRVLELLGHAIRLDTNRALYCLAQMDRDGKSASLVVESSLDALSDLITLKSTRSEESVIHSRDYIQKLMRIADSVSFERLFWMCEQYCTLRSAIRGSIDPMMDVRLTLIRISSHDIISADPVSMAEEIGALKREVSLLKRMHAEAMEGGSDAAWRKLRQPRHNRCQWYGIWRWKDSSPQGACLCLSRKPMGKNLTFPILAWAWR